MTEFHAPFPEISTDMNFKETPLAVDWLHYGMQLCEIRRHKFITLQALNKAAWLKYEFDDLISIIQNVPVKPQSQLNTNRICKRW